MIVHKFKNVLIANFLEKILFFLVLFLFIFIPLYPKFPLFNVTGTFVAIRLEDLFIAITMLIWIFYMFYSGKIKGFFQNTLMRTLLVFFFVSFISLISGLYLTHTIIDVKIGLLHYLRRIEFMMLLPVVFYSLKSKRQILTILLCLSFVVLAVNGYALGQKYLDWPVISTTNSEFSKGLILRITPGARVNSTFAGHYDLAVFLAMYLIFASSLFFAFNKKIKIWIVALSILSSVILIMTAARISFVAAVGGIFLTILLMRKKKFILSFVILLVFILIYPSQLRDRLVSTVTVNLFNSGQRYQAQNEDQFLRKGLNIPTLAIKTSSSSADTSTFATSSGKQASDITPGEPTDTTQLGVYRSLSIRLNLEWPRAIIGLLKNPLLGTGYSSLIINYVSNRVDAIAIDNDFLRSLGEVGILGTLAFSLILIKSLKMLYKDIKISKGVIKYLSIGGLGLVAGFLINATFIDVFEASKVATLFWMSMGMVLAGGKINNENI